MSLQTALKVIGRAFDPKRDIQSDAPRPLLLAKNAVEYLFRVAGFFILLCFTVGLTFSSCTQNPVLLAFPVVMGIAFFFYLAITTVGIPVFLVIAEIDNVVLRRVIGYVTVFAMLGMTVFSFFESPIFDILEIYVGKLFPEAFECRDAFIELDRPR